ncbi:MAG: ERCC4 domain-containing protein [Desulfobacterium sp.]|nr:ERCC4 domain-containing protein [Desulfobacterium sp.]
MSFTVLIDTREQLPVLLDKAGAPDFPDLKIDFASLKTGDYSLEGMEAPARPHSICIERKSLADLFSSTGRGRARFEREYQRMSEFDYAEIVVEGDLRAVFQSPPPLSQMVPKSVYRTVMAWSQRYRVNAWFCPNRTFAERHIYLSLQRFWADRQVNGVMEFAKI